MADKELIVNVSDSEVALALLEDKRLIEFNKEKRFGKFQVGDIYLGKVRKIMPGLNAAFVNVGHEKDAFLHYQDLGANFRTQHKYYVTALQRQGKSMSMQKIDFEPEIQKDGLISDVLTQGQTVIVQITKEPISTKGPRLSSEISLAGRNLILIPFSDKVLISSKIESTEEKNRLKTLLLSIKPKHYGVIVRTVAEGKKVAVLDAELRELVQRWESAFATIKKEISKPRLLLEDVDMSVAVLRDMFNPSFTNIYVDDHFVAGEISKYISEIAPDKKDIVKEYTGSLPIFEYYPVNKQIKSLFGRTVSFKHGAYLIIEHTEALHVIDVNSGNRSRSGNDQETNALEVNLEAAKEIARQLRLRDMGGIIVIDFIDMTQNEHKQQLYDVMKDLMEPDRTKHTILPLTKFGLMQITRQRVRPVMNIPTDEKCPDCLGTGVVRPALLFVDTIEKDLAFITENVKTKRLILHVHPFVASFLTKGLISIRMKWCLKYKIYLKVIAISAFHTLEHKFFDSENNEIDLT
ncbi:MAG: Rne/Rng family ribonuclease [Bacteroidales bacterium]|nr:Rne/Rng family ribonuclease [Bacteroidales bacterium]